MQLCTRGIGETLIRHLVCNDVLKKIGQVGFGRFKRRQVKPSQLLQVCFELFGCTQRWIIVVQIDKAKDPSNNACDFERELLRSSQLIYATQDQAVEARR